MFYSHCSCKPEDYIEIVPDQLRQMCIDILNHKDKLLHKHREDNIKCLNIIKTTPKCKLFGLVFSWNKRKETIDEARDRLVKEADSSLPDFPITTNYRGRIIQISKNKNHSSLQSELAYLCFEEENPFNHKRSPDEIFVMGFLKSCDYAENIYITKDRYRRLLSILDTVKKFEE